MGLSSCYPSPAYIVGANKLQLPHYKGLNLQDESLTMM